MIDRDGKRILQQYRKPAAAHLYEREEWVDVAELAPLPSTVRQLKPRTPAGG